MRMTTILVDSTTVFTQLYAHRPGSSNLDMTFASLVLMSIQSDVLAEWLERESCADNGNCLVELYWMDGRAGNRWSYQITEDRRFGNAAGLGAWAISSA